MKGTYISSKEMAKAGNPVNTFLARDGEYEVRITEVGVFSVRVKKNADILGSEEWEEGIYFKLPIIPWTLLQEIIAFFKSLCGCTSYEAMAYIMWDRENKKYFIYVPKQRVSAFEVDVELDTKIYRNYLPVMQVHSHNKMPARFSSKDDAEELETMLYAVIGRLDKFLPDITVRYSCGGHYREVAPERFFTMPDFPEEWTKKVTLSGEAL